MNMLIIKFMLCIGGIIGFIGYIYQVYYVPNSFKFCAVGVIYWIILITILIYFMICNTILKTVPDNDLTLQILQCFKFVNMY